MSVSRVLPSETFSKAWLYQTQLEGTSPAPGQVTPTTPEPAEFQKQELTGSCTLVLFPPTTSAQRSAGF